MPTIKIGGFFSALKDAAIDLAVRPYLPYIKQLDAEHVRVLVEHSVGLKEILPPTIAGHAAVKKLVTLDQPVFFRVLYKYHPRLAQVLDTPKGREWLEAQRRELS